MIQNTPSLAACIPEAARVTRLMESHSEFSLLRLGDGEIQCINAVRSGRRPPRYRYRESTAASVEAPFSVSGIEERHFPRLFESLNRCTYLDYCDSIITNQRNIPQLGIDRPAGLFCNPSPKASNIIFAWSAYELPEYVRMHRCLLAGAESSLLREMLKNPRYHDESRGFWPVDAKLFFHQVRNDGRYFSENLDLIKQDLQEEMNKSNCDTLFLSLATGAKILCYELAREMKIRAIDFGSMTRALTYSGSPGYHASRSFHNPFMFRISFPLFMSSLEAAHPDLDLPTVVSKAHSQLALEIQDLKPFRFNTSDVATGVLDLSAARLRSFRQALSAYNIQYRPRALKDPVASKLHKEFVRWRWKKGIGWDAKLFLLLVRLKGLLRAILGEKAVPVRKQV